MYWAIPKCHAGYKGEKMPLPLEIYGLMKGKKKKEHKRLFQFRVRTYFFFGHVACSLTRDGTQAPSSGSTVLATGWTRKSQKLL